MGGLVQTLVRALGEFYEIEKGDPPHLHEPACINLLRHVQGNINGHPLQIADELEMAIEDVAWYFKNRVTYRKSGEFFLLHTGMAILLFLGEA